MRVVHLIDSGGFYGAEVMLLNLCIEQKKQGMNVEVISIGTPNVTTFQQSLGGQLRHAKQPDRMSVRKVAQDVGRDQKSVGNLASAMECPISVSGLT
ncbi:MAG: hypothetical protein EOO68_27400 [Moraxellaceae bacterium]|nr:MAG: hypothetical protein EOO68_27400 [Moraxellaceae bacterium]